MHRLTSLAVSLVLAVPAVAFADKSYNEAGMKVTHNCAKDKDGPTAMINGTDGTYAFTGACTKIGVNGSTNKITIDKATAINVNGNGNTIAVEGADKISVTGNDNKVSWKKGVAGDKPAVSNIGNNNAVSRSK